MYGDINLFYCNTIYIYIYIYINIYNIYWICCLDYRVLVYCILSLDILNLKLLKVYFCEYTSLCCIASGLFLSFLEFSRTVRCLLLSQKTRYLFSVVHWKSINDLNLYYSSNFDRKVICYILTGLYMTICGVKRSFSGLLQSCFKAFWN